MKENSGSGLHFNPFLTRIEQRELTGWMKLKEEDYIKIPGMYHFVFFVVYLFFGCCYESVLIFLAMSKFYQESDYNNVNNMGNSFNLMIIYAI